MDSNLVETNIYRWYAQGESYPIYETLDSHVKGNNIGFKVAYYYSPQSLKDNEYEKSGDIFREREQKLPPMAVPVFPDMYFLMVHL